MPPSIFNRQVLLQASLLPANYVRLFDAELLWLEYVDYSYVVKQCTVSTIYPGISVSSLRRYIRKAESVQGVQLPIV